MSMPTENNVDEMLMKLARDEYDASFRAAITEALAEPGPGIPHAQVIAETEKLLSELENRKRG